MADIHREELERLYQTLDDGFKGTHTRLDKMNGRLGLAEQRIAVLDDRSEDAKQAAVNAGRMWGGLGTLLGAAMGAWHFLAGGGK